MPRHSKKQDEIKRPFANYYGDDPRRGGFQVAAQGFAATEKGAIRASVVRIFMGEHSICTIYDRRDGTLVYTVRLTTEGLKVHYGQAPESAQLRRVK